MKWIQQNTKIILFLFLSIFGVSPSYAKNTCSTRTLKKVCDMCEERALNKASSQSTASQSILESSDSSTCLQPDSYNSFLKENYTLIARINNNAQDYVYMLTITKDENYPRFFNYSAKYPNDQIAIENNTGYLFYETTIFDLPMQYNYYSPTIFSYSCIGSINDSSIINGSCSTIAKDINGIPQSFSFPFIAVPSPGSI